MPEQSFRTHAIAAIFLVVLVWTAFYGAYSGRQSSTRPPPQHDQTIDAANQGAHRGAPGSAIVESVKSAEDRIADYTWWVGAFTLALAIVSSFQIYFLIQADKTARITAEAAKESADAARANAAAAQASADAQRATLVAMSPPKVIVRRIAVSLMEAGKPVSVRYAVVNVGGTTATLTRIREAVVLRQGALPPIPVWQMDPTEHSDAKLDSGASMLTVAKSRDRLTPHAIVALTQMNIFLYVYGTVGYVDEIGAYREVGFGRVYNAANKRFDPITDDEYEYAY